ncbi:S41 family peptidase [Paenibacillus sp. GCM10027626]|uniref:S41 family peptidase n=1 Tax=Paenibacillus sp. GCM10027626 TaxID=3273411 RepID=UPI00363EC9D0
MNIYGAEAARQRKRMLLALALVVACAIGIIIGRWLVFYQYPILESTSFRNLSYTYDKIMDDYLEGAESHALINGAAEGMVASLGDPYSVYLTGEKGEDYMKSYEDHFVGIGVEIRQQDGDYIIENATLGSPAEKAGLQHGDIVRAVDNKSVKGMAFDQLLKLVKGKEGTKVTLIIDREKVAEPLAVTVERGTVPVHTLSYEMKGDHIGMIVISRFADKTGEEFDQAIAALKEKGMQRLLLDLRSNPGGLLEPTIHIANTFVPKGKTIVQVVNKDERRIVTHTSEQAEAWKLPLAILVDSHTASSAEVLTAALKETAGAEVIGERTFGKGIVQQFRQLPDGSVLKLTEAQWRSPDGQWIHKKGIEPTIAVAPPDYTQLSPIAAGKKLQEGDYGQRVEAAQNLLQALGYSTGPAIGIYSKEMRETVQLFQRQQGIPETGELNDRTAYEISRRLLEKYKAEDPQMKKALEVLQAK